MPNDDNHEEDGLFPPSPEALKRIFKDRPESLISDDIYGDLIESMCGMTDDSQAVEQYDGTLGVNKDFVDAHETMVGQLQWNSDLADKFTEPGNVSGARWCTGTMISDNLFLTAGHCFDQTGGNWQRPKVNGSNDIISPSEIVKNMHINFNYQADAGGTLQTATEIEVQELIEYRLGDLDYAIVRLADSPGQNFGVGEIEMSDAAEDDMLCIIGHPAGVPKRIEAGPLTALDGDRIRYNDIDTLGGNSGSAMWRAASGKIVGVHTNGGCQNPGGSNSGMRISRLLEESPTLQSIALPALQGRFTIQQKSNNRFMDAHDGSNEDFSAVTRTAQNNDTQRWVLTPVGQVCTVQQLSSDRFADAHETQDKDFSVVSRTAQNNNTQRWVFRQVPNELSAYTIQQLSNGRYMDAHDISGADFSVVTRSAQNNKSQQWKLGHLGGNAYTVRQLNNGRYLDAHQSSSRDFSLATRTNQNNDTQRWTITPVGYVCTIQQASNGQFLDAHDSNANDFSAVTRKVQNNDTQRWVVMPLGDNTYTIQQLSNGQYLDAHDSSSNDFSVVTRTAQNNDTQRWIIKSV